MCQCQNQDLDELEKFYINKYDTFNKGYNLTTGGQLNTTSLNLNPQEVIEKYNEIPYIYEVAKNFKCCEKTISNILKQEGIIVKTTLCQQSLENLTKGIKFKEGDHTKAVRIIELNLTFNSLKECSQWLIDNNYSKASTMEIARKSLSIVLNGDRASYCGLHFEFI